MHQEDIYLLFEKDWWPSEITIERGGEYGDNGGVVFIAIYFSPADVCLNFSLFFFLHFHGLKSRPKLANLLRRRMGGVCVPGTSESERIAASRSTSSAGNKRTSRS